MQIVNLQVTPSGVNPIIHVSQFDVGRQFQLKLYDGPTAYSIPSGAVPQIDGIKPDQHGFSYTDAVSVSGNTLTVTTKEQMTIVSGTVECEIRFVKDGLDVGSINFKMLVEKSPINEDTDISETDLPVIIALAKEQEENAEAWAKGTKDGVEVSSDAPQYHNHSKYYSEQSANSATASANSANTSDGFAQESEAWAKGTKNGTPVGSDDDTYHNHSKYWAQVSNDFSGISKSWAVGPSGLGDAGTDTDNSKYWSNVSYGYAQQVATYMNSINAIMALIHLLFDTIYTTTESGDRLITESGDYLILDF